MLGKKVSTDIKCYVFLQYFSYTSTQVFDYLLAEFVRVFVRVCYLAFDLSFIHLINCHIEGNDLFFFLLEGNGNISFKKVYIITSRLIFFPLYFHYIEHFLV